MYSIYQDVSCIRHIFLVLLKQISKVANPYQFVYIKKGLLSFNAGNEQIKREGKLLEIERRYKLCFVLENEKISSWSHLREVHFILLIYIA